MSAEAVTTFRELADWVQSANPDSPSWGLDSNCPGWTNGDILIHLACTIRELVEPESLPPPDTTSIERTNDRQVDAFRVGTVREHLAEYTRLLPGALTVLADLQADTLRDETFDLFDAGVYPVHLCADALVFDHYCHLVHDTTLAGALPPVPPSLVEPAVAASMRWLVAGIPQMSGAPLAAALIGPVGLRISGPGGGAWLLSPPTSEAGPVECTPVEYLPETTIDTDASDFILWGTKRRSCESCAVALGGDRLLAERVAAAIHVY